MLKTTDLVAWLRSLASRQDDPDLADAFVQAAYEIERLAAAVILTQAVIRSDDLMESLEAMANEGIRGARAGRKLRRVAAKRVADGG